MKLDQTLFLFLVFSFFLSSIPLPPPLCLVLRSLFLGSWGTPRCVPAPGNVEFAIWWEHLRWTAPSGSLKNNLAAPVAENQLYVKLACTSNSKCIRTLCFGPTFRFFAAVAPCLGVRGGTRYETCTSWGGSGLGLGTSWGTFFPKPGVFHASHLLCLPLGSPLSPISSLLVPRTSASLSGLRLLVRFLAERLF